MKSIVKYWGIMVGKKVILAFVAALLLSVQIPVSASSEISDESECGIENGFFECVLIWGRYDSFHTNADAIPCEVNSDSKQLFFWGLDYDLSHNFNYDFVQGNASIIYFCDNFVTIGFPLFGLEPFQDYNQSGTFFAIVGDFTYRN